MKNTSSVYQNYASKTDLEVIEIYKNNSHWRTKREIETYFYQKYIPLCKKYSYKYRYIQPMEDNMQDCYFQMVQALDYVDINKVTNPEMYSFGITFRGYLSSHFIAEIKKYKEEFEIHVEYTEFYEVHTKHMGKNKDLKYRGSVQENSVIFKIYKQKFEETLSEKEKRLFKMLADGMKKKDIVKELGKKHTANLTFWVNKIQKKYVEFNNSIGYEIAI
jgi:thiol-disulfide isomerase/thioredoxin